MCLVFRAPCLFDLARPLDMKPLSWTRGLEGDWTFISRRLGVLLGIIGGYWNKAHTKNSKNGILKPKNFHEQDSIVILEHWRRGAESDRLGARQAN